MRRGNRHAQPRSVLSFSSTTVVVSTDTGAPQTIVAGDKLIAEENRYVELRVRESYSRATCTNAPM